MTRRASPLLILPILLLGGCGTSRARPELNDGDIIFQTSKSSQTLAIQRATRSPYSHVGMIVHRDGKPFVFEASEKVRFTSLDAWIASGEDAHYVVKRLRPEATRLTPEAFEKVRAAMSAFEGEGYDPTFGWSDTRMYCSELVWKIYDRALGVRIGELQKLRDFDLTDPAVQAKLRERYGNDVPLDEPVISPAAMFASQLLEVVVQQ